MATVGMSIRGEKKIFFIDKMIEIAGIIKNMPIDIIVAWQKHVPGIFCWPWRIT